MRAFRVLGLAAGVGIGVAAARIWRDRTIERSAGAEGIDDPAVAEGFTRMASLPPLRLLRRIMIARALALRASGAAVDLGCGPGFGALELAQAAPELRVTGVDLSNPLLSQALTRAAGAGLSHRVDFRSGDAGSTGLPAASYDLVVSMLSLHHWSDPVAVLDETARLLKPGGAFVIFDLRRDMPPPAYLAVWAATRWVVPAALRRVREPLGSRNAAFTPAEAATLAQASRLTGWGVVSGPFWLSIEGRLV